MHNSPIWCALATRLGPEPGGEDAAVNVAESLPRGACVLVGASAVSSQLARNTCTGMVSAAEKRQV